MVPQVRNKVLLQRTCTYDWALSYDLEGAVAWVMPSRKFLI